MNDQSPAHRPTTVILPTVQRTPVVEEIAAQLTPEDELLVVCDGRADPVTDQVSELAGVRTVIAGEPRGCSGKANAIAAGMEAAQHDRIVWTDDDFHHPPDWLADLQRSYEQFGPVSELYFFRGTDPLSVLLEPGYLLGGTLGTHATNKAWGGSVMFERDDLDVARFVQALRRTTSDDALLSEFLYVTTLKRVRRVDIGGTIRETLYRHVRFTQIVRHHDPQDTVAIGVVTSILTIAALLAPIQLFFGLTAITAVTYAYFGIRRWTFLCVVPAVLLQGPLTAYALSRSTFVWTGRRYRWESKFDVTVEF